MEGTPELGVFEQLLASEASKAKVPELLDLLRTDALRRADDLRAGVASGDTEVVRHAAHALSGLCAIVGASELVETCRSIDLDARAGKLPTTEAIALLDDLGAVLSEHAAEVTGRTAD